MFIPKLRFLIVAVLYLNHVWCAKLLLLFNFPSKSVHLSALTMAEILTEKGHNVTTVTPYENSSSIKHSKHIVLNEVMKQFNDDEMNYLELNNKNRYLELYIYTTMGISITNATFRDPNFEYLLKENLKFDLVILDLVFCESLMYIAEYMGSPLMLYTSLDASFMTNTALGNPAPPAYVSHTLSHYLNEMTFFERLDNLLLHLTSELIRNFKRLPAHDKIVKEYFPGAPNIYEYYTKASVMLLNGDISVTDAMPKAPGMIDIGGIHIKPPESLPEHLAEILNEAEYGVIYFSLGSNVKSKDIPDHIVKGLLTVFSELKEVVLWKWEREELIGKPPNVIIQKWFPQNDILAHKNVKLFITHAGLHSILESVYYGVPCLALPVFGDQIMNAKRAAKVGYAECIKFEELTMTNFKWSLKRLLNNPRYREVAKERARIMQDKPYSRADTLGYWVDYVIRHKGANHLKLASLSLNWYQYILLDVIAFIILFVVLLFIVVRCLVKKFIKIN